MRLLVQASRHQSTQETGRPALSMVPIHLRFAADRRTIGFVAAYFVAFFTVWFGAPRTSLGTALGVVVLASLSWFCAVITHNVVHSPLWTSRTANRITQVALSLSYGFAVSDYVPGHNLSHHRYLQTRRDVMRTTKVRFGTNVLNFASFFFVVAPAIVASNGRFLRAGRVKNASFHRQRLLEVIVVWSVKTLFVWLDWRRAIAFVILPHLWAVWAITSVNFLQHDGCDPDHPVNHSRNFVGRVFNWFHFNNGFHGIHHLEPGMHWSLLPGAHAAQFHPTIDPQLEQRSLAVYLWRTFVLPGQRVDLRGAPLILPDEGPDQDWSVPAAQRT